MFVSVLVTNGLISSEIGVDATGAGPDGPDTGVPAVIAQRRTGDRPDPGSDRLAGHAAEDGRPDLRRRARPDVDPAGAGGAGASTTFRARSSWSAPGWRTTRSWSRPSAPPAPRSGCTPSPTPSWREVSPTRVDQRDHRDPAGPGRGDRAAELPGPAAVLLGGRRRGRRGLRGCMQRLGGRATSPRWSTPTARTGSDRASTPSSARVTPVGGHRRSRAAARRAAVTARRPSPRWTGSSRSCRPRAYRFTTVSAGVGPPAGGLRRPIPSQLAAGAGSCWARSRWPVVVAALEWACSSAAGWCCCGCADDGGGRPARAAAPAPRWSWGHRWPGRCRSWCPRSTSGRAIAATVRRWWPATTRSR